MSSSQNERYLGGKGGMLEKKNKGEIGVEGRGSQNTGILSERTF